MIPAENSSNLIQEYELACPTHRQIEDSPRGLEVTRFQSHFTGGMELYANVERVTDYLDAHRGWFCRCAQPMQVEPIGENGYVLTIGRFGSFGYEVEPKIGLDLLPQEAGVYRIQTITLPEQDSQGYQVDFQAAMHLVEQDLAANSEPARLGIQHCTHVGWQLDLGVLIHFPRFIHRLPQALIQRTGDRLLSQIVKQVSNCLTAKVQDDFHATLGLSVPKRWRRPHLHTD
ncbi:MAG: DUF1997 domain-containing protein [Aphanocapsa sp. GSE-SYN-MK-11-07L]|jgi:hypothetical protein|nr:DUF1997 domain-containing protein [Aphanocapsa sp. GSE-SYN-MK-11-07L]